jgi:mRNA interferase MazF
MKQPGQIVLFRFPQTDLIEGKLRPALLLAEVPNPYDDWLICMISSQLHHHIEGFTEVITREDTDFSQSGLKEESVIRIGRLAVIEASVLSGAIGKISPDRLERVKRKLADWLTDTH